MSKKCAIVFILVFEAFSLLLNGLVVGQAGMDEISSEDASRCAERRSCAARVADVAWLFSRLARLKRNKDLASA